MRGKTTGWRQFQLSEDNLIQSAIKHKKEEKKKKISILAFRLINTSALFWNDLIFLILR